MNISESLRKRIAHKAVDLGTDSETLIEAVLEEVFEPRCFAGFPPDCDDYGGYVSFIGGGFGGETWLVPHWFRGLIPNTAINKPWSSIATQSSKASEAEKYEATSGMCHKYSGTFRARGSK